MLFINPPFGNYINFPKTISIKGSFTLEPRSGLFSQILKTMRYSFYRKGWVNKIGLRNPGLVWALDKYTKNDILSIAILHEQEVDKILKILPENQNIELNTSCPNIDEGILTQNLSKFLNNYREWCIIKLSPTIDKNIIDEYYKQGFRQFHCSNTLKVENGGLSSKGLVPYTCSIIQYLQKYDDITIIAGGGVYDSYTYNKYMAIGADHIAISTLFLYPHRIPGFFYEYYKNI